MESVSVAGTWHRVWNVFGLIRGEGLRAQLLRGGVGSIAIKIGHTVLAFLVAVELARSLGAKGYGVYAFVFALVSMLAIPTQLGLPQLMVRETAKAQTNEQWGLMRGLWRWSTAAVWVFSFGIMLAVLAAVWWFDEQISDVQRTTLIFGLLLIPLVALGNLRGAALRGLRRVVLGQLPEKILKPGLLVLCLLVLLLAFPAVTLTPAVAMALHAAAAAAAFSIGAWLLWRYRPAQLTEQPSPVYQARYWIAAALPLALIASLQLINAHADILMLGMFRSAEEVGIYKVALTGASLVTFGLQAVNQVVSPYFASLYAQADIKRLQRLATQAARASLALAMPVVLAFILFGDSILTVIFGTDFSTGYIALAIMAVGQLINAGMGSVGALLNMTGHERDTMCGLLIAAISNIALNLMLIPPFGIIGAAFTTALTLTLWNITLWWFVRRRLGINSTPFAFSRI